MTVSPLDPPAVAAPATLPPPVTRHHIALEAVDADDLVAASESVAELWPWLLQDWVDTHGPLPVGRMVVAVLPLEHPQVAEFLAERPQALEAVPLSPLQRIVAVDLTDDLDLPVQLVHTLLLVGPSGDPADVVVLTAGT
jgi:hypothetical protein